MANGWLIDPSTGDYVLSNGRPVTDPTLNTPAYFRLKTRRTQWLYAPDDTYGSDFYLYGVRHTSTLGINLAAVGNRALKPLVDQGRATSADVEINTETRSSASLTATLVSTGGMVQTLDLDSITG
jgi:phage gp46-like protein